ncbi:MFS general substrate transporter [Choiromyces venosus 120613-1]|uniref:MFS general substrate transporter n=1 Tax=Choiromyces venosus 120613-1 TaxID=1336337 RepID=A0A3N4JKK9_9PEZI|nr:MFS general substrate transporter [Choiromyces venosus 120613-1]
MGIFLNPFKIHSRDREILTDVVAPISSAPRYIPGKRAAQVSSSPSSSSVESGTIANAPECYTFETLRAAIAPPAGTTNVENTPYSRKSRVVNLAIQDIGMGPYTWRLFALCGFGWFADNMWLQGLALILTSIQREFGIEDSRIGYTTCALFVGLCCGAVGWGVLSDFWGRRIAFNATLAIAAVFGLAVGGANSWITTAALFACLGTGVGGNLPVDGALFLEFLPEKNGNLLAGLSVWWPVGQLVGSLVAWGFVPKHSCTAEVADAGHCRKEDNMGWRYLIITLGGLTMVMFIARFFTFHLYESPKFYISRGRDGEAVSVVHGIAHKNKTKTWLTLDLLRELSRADDDHDHGNHPSITATTPSPSAMEESSKLSAMQIIKTRTERFTLKQIRPLFADRKLGLTTALVWFCWATIGMGYPLFNAFLPIYLTKNGAGGVKPNSIVYRNYAITSIVGVPGSLVAMYTIDTPYFGRKHTLSISTLLSGIFLFLFTISTQDTYQLTFTCLEAFFQNIMYGCLYTFTPELFPAPVRGTGVGLASFINRVAGLCAPIIATNTIGRDPNVPVYVAGGLILAAGVAVLGVPVETRGREKL